MLKKSYLDLIPMINNDNLWITGANDRIVINTKRKGFVQKMGLKNFSEPKERQLELDGYGSIVWKKIDGHKTIRDIAEEIMRELGEEREFAKQRAAMFFKMLKMHGLILFVNNT